MSNEKGFTLIELLAGLLLFSIVSVAAVSLTVQAMHNNTNAETTNSLRNDATYVTQVLRTAYENGTLNDMCAEGNTLNSSNDNINLALTDNNILKDVKFSYEGSDPSKPNCFNSQSEVKNLQVNFTISHENGEDEIETFDVNTAFSKPTKDELTVSLAKPETPPNTDSPFVDSCKVFEESLGIIKTNIDKGKGNGKNRDNLEYTGDTEITETQFNTNNYNSVKVINGNLTIPNSVSIHKILFEVDHNFNVQGALKLQESSDTNIGKLTSIQDSLTFSSKSSLETGSLLVKNQLTTHNSSVLMVQGNAEAGSGAFFTKSSSCIGGDATFKEDLQFQNSSSLISGGALTAPVLRMFYLSTVSIDKGVTIAGEMELQNNARLEVGEGLYAGGNTTLNSSAFVSAKEKGTFGNGLIVRNSAELSLYGPVNVGGTTLVETNANLIANGSGRFGGNITLRNTGGQFTINGDMVADQSIILEENAVIYVKGNLHIKGNLSLHKNAKIIAGGNITVDGKTEYNWSNATVCAGGSNSINQSNVPNMTILNNQKCQK